MATNIHVVSAPALAAALRTVDRSLPPAPPTFAYEPRHLAPMYRLVALDLDDEVAAAVHLASDVADRLRRLKAAYGEWQVFEPGPYFDLAEAQVAQLVHVAERVSTVHVTFFIDALLPSFQQAADHLANVFAPAWRSHSCNDATLATMTASWQRLIAVLQGTRRLLLGDIGFLAANSAHDERIRWRAAWLLPAAAGLGETLLPPLAVVPTLTLSVEFPLPLSRQPGRLRRLRRAWERRQTQKEN